MSEEVEDPDVIARITPEGVERNPGSSGETEPDKSGPAVDEAVKILVDALYHGDGSDFRSALWGALVSLHPEAARMLEDSPDAAWERFANHKS